MSAWTCNPWSSELDRQDAMKLEAYKRNTTMTDYDKLKGPEDVGLLPTGENRGPHRWDEITKEDFAKDFDYVIQREGSVTILICKSEAALQWCYAHLDQDGPRWGVKGFVVETNRYLNPILHGMANANLVSDEEYEYNMNADERDRHAGEDQ